MLLAYNNEVLNSFSVILLAISEKRPYFNTECNCHCHYGSFHVEYVEDIPYHDLNSWCETDAIGIA